MGRQIRFYMAEEDEAVFIRALRAYDDVVVIAARGTSPEPVILDELPNANSSVDASRMILWNRSLNPGLGLRAYGPHLVVDKRNEPVIEFHRTTIRDGLFQEGRLWYQSKPDEPTYDASTARALSSWYDACVKLIKANSEAVGQPSSRDYLWPGAKRLIETGAVKLGYEFIRA